MTRERGPQRRSLPVINQDRLSWQSRAIVALFKLHNRLERRLSDGLAPHGLTLAQFDVLMTLCRTDGITQQELAEWLLVTKANVVGLIDRLSAAGWVQRRPDPEDRRVNRLYLTDVGRKIAAEAHPGQHALVKTIFGRLTESELSQLHALLGRLDEACEE